MIPESVFTFIPDSRSTSSRNLVRLHPGTAFTLPRIPQQSSIEHYAPESTPRQKHLALLRGLLHCEACGVPMIPVHVGRHGHRYRYYVCRTRNKGSATPCPSRSLPAQDIDHAVLSRINAMQDEDIPSDLAAQIIYFQERIERVGYDGITGRVNIRFREKG